MRHRFRFRPSVGSFCGFGHPVFWFDLVTAVAIDASSSGFWRRHRAGDSIIAVFLKLTVYTGNQLFIFFASQPLLDAHQVIFEPGNRIALAPILKQRLGDVVGGVVDGMAFHAHHLGFDQRGTLAAPGALTGFMGGVVNLVGVGAINDYAGDAVGNGALREIFYAKLHVGGRGVSPEIVFDEKYQAEVLNGGEIQAFIRDSSGLAAVANVGHDSNFASLKARTKRHAGEHGDEIAEGRDGRDYVALVDVSEMR